MRSPRPLLASATVLTGLAALVGCAGSGDGAPETSYVTQTVAQDNAPDNAPDSAQPAGPEPTRAGESPADAVIRAYSDVLDSPGRYPFTGGGNYSLNGEYEYALVEMTGDDVPELLVKALTTDHIDPVRVFSTTDDGTLIAPDDTLVSGAAGAGGYRAAVHATPGGDRILQTEWHSLRPERTVRGFTLRGDSLVADGEEWEEDGRSPSGRLVDVTFHPLHDRGPLQALEPGTAAPVTAGGPAPTPPAVAPAPDGGNIVTGTVRVLTAPELARLQGHDRTPNGEDDSHRFALLVLDVPTMFTAKASGDRGALQDREASMVLLGSQTPYASDSTGFDLAGQRLTLSFDRNGCWFPSDTSLPLGQPRCEAFTRR